MASFHAPFENWPAAAKGPIGRSFEATIEAIYTGCLRKGDAMIDGGAAVGRHTKPPADLVGPNGLVIAIDANPDMRDELLKRFASRPQVRVEHGALGPGGDDLEFTIALENLGRSSLHTAPAITRTRKVTVKQLRMHDFDTGSRRVRFIKLDLEGGEYDALRGATNLLRTHQPVMCLEHLRKVMPLFGVDYAAYFALFEEAGYDLVDILGSAFTPEVATWDGWKPQYVVALPRQDAELSEAALAALGSFTRQHYGDALQG